MDYEIVRYAALILLGILFYAVLARGLFNATEPYRRQTIDIAEKLSHSTQVSNQKKEFVYDRLGDVYSPLEAWKLAASMVKAFVRLPFINAREVADRVDAGIPQHLRQDFNRFKNCWVAAVLGNSPLASFLFVTLALILIAFFVSLSVLSGWLVGGDENGNHHKAAT
jgi:hypothetical protein